jgi:hypothetical protein
MSKIQNNKFNVVLVWSICALVIGACFVLRASDFGFHQTGIKFLLELMAECRWLSAALSWIAFAGMASL